MTVFPARPRRLRGSSTDLASLPGIGPVNAAKLIAVGITTAAQLRNLGSRRAWARIRAEHDPGACLHLLYGLEAAVQGIPKRELSAQTKRELREFAASVGS